MESPHHSAGPEFALLDSFYTAFEEYLLHNFDSIQARIHGVFVWGPCMFAFVGLGMSMVLHWREVWDLSSLSFPKYTLYNSWNNSHCKTPLDRTLVFVYHCCWAVTGVYAGVEFILQYASCDIGPVGPHKFIDRLLYPLPTPGGMGACKLALHNAFLLTLVITVMLLRIFTMPSSLFLFSGSLVLIFGHYGLRFPLFSTLSCSLFGLSSALFILQLGIASVLSMSTSAKGHVAQPKKDVDADAKATADINVSVKVDVVGERYSNIPPAHLRSSYSFHYPIGLAAIFFMTINIMRTPHLHGMCLEVESSDKWTLWLSSTLHFLVLGGVAAMVVMSSSLMSYIRKGVNTRRKKWMGSERGGRTE